MRCWARTRTCLTASQELRLGRGPSSRNTAGLTDLLDRTGEVYMAAPARADLNAAAKIWTAANCCALWPITLAHCSSGRDNGGFRPALP